jgi:hypothetical protein
MIQEKLRGIPRFAAKKEIDEFGYVFYVLGPVDEDGKVMDMEETIAEVWDAAHDGEMISQWMVDCQDDIQFLVDRVKELEAMFQARDFQDKVKWTF